MKVGSLIKFHRTKQGLTQQTLADGICSVPHLSKIENNSKEANEETIRLLLERLNIGLQDVEKLEGEIQKLIKQFADEMYYLEMDQLFATFNLLKDKEELIPFTDQLYLYEIYKARYHLLTNNVEKAEKQLKWLQSHKQNFSQHEGHLHSYISALALAIRGKVEDADRLLAELLDKAYLTAEVIGEISYNYSVLKASLSQSGPSIYYGKNALQQFKEDYNFTRIVQVQMLLAVNYSSANMYNEAVELYQHLLRNTRKLSMQHYTPQIYHNMGDLYHRMKDFEKASFYFSSAMNLLPDDSDLFILCLYNKGISEVLNGKERDGEESFNRLADIAMKTQKHNYVLFSKYYILRINNRDDEAMAFLENKLIPYLRKSSDMKESLAHFSNILSDFYKDKGYYDKALEFMH